MRKGFLSIFLLILLFLQAQAQYNVVRIRFPASTYSAQLRGVTGTTTAGLTIQGTYSSNLGAHVFKITITGPYKLYFDAAGGSNYSFDSQWSDSYGTNLLGYPDAMNAADFVAKVDPDGDDSLSAVFIEDSTFALRKLTTAAYNFIGSGGSVTNNPDDVTLENKSGSTLGIKDNYLGTQLQFKDTTQLKAATSDSVGMVVNLKQLSSSNTKGGGQFVYRPADEYAVDAVTCFASGNASYEWVRVERLKSPDVYVEWAGAIPNDANDDFAAIDNAYDLAETLEGDVLFGSGDYRSSAKITITTTGTSAQTSVRKPFIIGKGRNRTKLTFYNNTDGIHFDGGPSRFGDHGVWDLHIIGNSKAAGTSGVILDSTGVGGLKRCFIEGFETGVRIIQCNQALLEDNFIGYNTFGVYATTSPNELTCINNYFSENDSIQFYQITGNGTHIIGGQIQGSNTDPDVGLYGIRIATGTAILTNVSVEGIKIAFADLESNGSLICNKIGVLAGRDSTRFAIVRNGKLKCFDSGISNNHADTTDVLMYGTNAQAEFDNQTAMTVRWKPTTVWYDYNPTTNVRGLSATALTGLATEARWGKFYRLHQRPGSQSEIPFLVTKMRDSNYFTAPIINDQRITNSWTVQPAIDSWPGRNVHGFESFSMAELDPADSIMNFTVIVDTSGWNTLYSASCIVEYNNIADTTKNFATRTWIADVNAAAGTGTITFCVDWSQSSTLPPTGQTFIFRWHAYIRPLGWTQP